MKRFLTLPNLILAALVSGILFGWAAGASNLFATLPSLLKLFETGGAIFKNLIFMVIVPLVVFSLIGGMMGIGDLRKLGRIAWKTLAIFATTTALACVIGLMVVNLIQPGRRVTAEARDRIAKEYQAKQRELVGNAEAARPSLWSFVQSLAPKNVFAAASDNSQMLPLIFFSMFFGLAAAALEGPKRLRLGELIGAVTDVMIRMVQAVMWIAPVGVFCLISVSMATTGLSVLGALAAYGAVVLLALALHVTVVYGAALRLLTKVRLPDYLRAARPALLTAFGTSSSAATLPVNMECVEKRLNVSREVTSFVLPLGATVNMDGTAIMQSVATVFLAQLYSIPLGLTDQLFIVLMATLASVGTAPIPSAGIAMLVIILGPLHIPLEGLALIWAVDRPLDMARTVMNITGDGVTAAAVAASEGEDVRYIPAV